MQNRNEVLFDPAYINFDPESFWNFEIMFSRWSSHKKVNPIVVFTEKKLFGIGPWSFDPIGAILTQNCGCFVLFQGFKSGQNWKISPLLLWKFFQGTKVDLFFNFGPSETLKRPQTPQILSLNCAKTTGLNH